MSDLAFRDLVEIARLLRAGEVSAVEVATACLERAERLQPVLNTFISLDRDGAMRKAERADRARALGQPLGPLHGVPIAHKDIFYRTDRVVTCGSRLRRDFRPDHGATVVERLEAAGAVDLGGLNTSEFACNPYGVNVLVGRARNPWKPEVITGGSSSGSAASTAARIVYGSLGSDTGGSVRLPAAICGVVGLLPTQGRVSRHGVMKLSFSLDNAGPLARSVRDVASLLGVIAGADPMDPTTSDAPVPDYEAGLDAPVTGKRIGIAADHLQGEVAPDVRARVEAALAVFRDQGAEVVEVHLPDRAMLDALANLIILAEAAAIHARWIRERGDEYTPLVRDRIAFGFSFPATRYIEALSLRGRLLDEVLATAFARADVLFTPMLEQPPPVFAEVEAALAARADLTFDLARNTRLFNYLGLPGLSVPCGLDSGGLPVAFQLVGRPFAEGLILNLGHQYQLATDHHLRPPPV